MKEKLSNRIKNIQGNSVRKIFSLLTKPEIISFAGGFPTKKTLPLETIKTLANQVLSSSNAHDVLQYGPSEGYVPLKNEIFKFLDKYKAIKDLSLKNMLVISGGQQGIDFMCKCFINPGDIVLVEDPTYLA
ncbi:MAG: aminotransferase class I/II-fold pyridoxal phosphate-dependent enzyme, partial [Bacilli bacterium]|nr:aminotransferase class I/II-fold pyridoxal phosphate-dependent enzyme [Bacilli bacterium]